MLNVHAADSMLMLTVLSAISEFGEPLQSIPPSLDVSLKLVYLLLGHMLGTALQFNIFGNGNALWLFIYRYNRAIFNLK